ncbi:olfactory receptor 10K1-like [Gastrophryne carolinensis]
MAGIMVRPAAGHGNQTVAYVFIILGFNTFDIMERFLFYVICVTYFLTLGVHSVIVTLVVTDRKLHKPMYVFLANFSIAEILYTTASTPKMLDSLWTKNKEISYSACLAQFYCFFAFGAVEHFFLVIMGYDRY